MSALGTVRGRPLPRTDSPPYADVDMKTPPDSSPLARALTIARWRTIVGLRAFAHDSVHTAQGRLVVAMSLFALIPIWQILRNRENTLERYLVDGAHASFTIGGVVLGEAALVLSFLIILPILLIKEFLIDGKRGVLHDHPFSFPEEAVVRAAGVILWLSVFLWTSFHLFFLHLLLHPEGGSRWLRVLVHAVAGQLFFLAVGAVIACATRLLLVRMAGVRWAVKAFPFAIVPFLLGYPLFLLLPSLLGGKAPDRVALLGGTGATPLHLVLTPVLTWLEAVDGGWSSVAGSLFLLMGMAASGGAMLWRWRDQVRADLMLEPDSVPRRMHPLTFLSVTPSPRWRREFRLFWLKDVVAPARRNPLREIRTHGLLLTLGFLAVVGLSTGVKRGDIGEPVVQVGVSSIILCVAALLAMRHTLGRIGTEGRALLCLRPHLSPLRLFAIKLATGVAACVVQFGGYSLLLWTSLAAFGLPAAAPLQISLEGTGSILLFAPFGATMGFILPDLRRDGYFLRGASNSGKVIYLAGVVPSCALYLAGRWMSALDGAPANPHLVLTCAAVALLLGLGLSLLPASLRIYDRIVP